MRELDECKAEVLRRSEHRIKERRKKRRQFLLCAVPLCLGTIMWATLLLPEILPAGGETERDNVVFETVDISGPFIRAEFLVEGQLTDESKKITDADVIADIQAMIEHLYQTHMAQDDLEQESTSLGTEDIGNESTSQGSEEEKKVSEGDVEKEYVITFVRGEAAEKVYILRGAALMDVNSQKEITLSEGQIEELCQLLGLEK